MKGICTAALFCLFSLPFFPAWAQENANNAAKTDSMMIMLPADIPPQFPGGDEAMLAFLRAQIQHTDLTGKPEGLTVLSMIITKEGAIRDIRVLQSLEPSLDSAAIEAVKKMPRWTPGMYKGQVVDTRGVVPIRFSKENQQKTKIKKKASRNE